MGANDVARDGPCDLTVVVPLFNGERYIAETLTSIAQQTLRPAEVLVIDDGSDDGGPAVVRDHPVGARLVEQPRLGVAVARNRGLAETRTRWVAFLDQDDLWHASRLERLWAWIGGHPDEGLIVTTEVGFSSTEEHEALVARDSLVGSWAGVLVPAPTALADLQRAVDVEGSDDVERFDHRDLLTGPITKTTSFIARTDLLRLAGGFAPHALAMDDYWLLVNTARLQAAVRVNQPTVFYRIHMGATSRSTKLALPFLSSAIALRLGGGVIPVDEGLEGGSTGPLHRHLLDELLRSEDFRDRRVQRAARDLAGLLWPDGRRVEIARAHLRTRLPWVAAARRRVTSRGMGVGGVGA